MTTPTRTDRETRPGGLRNGRAGKLVIATALAALMTGCASANSATPAGAGASAAPGAPVSASAPAPSSASASVSAEPTMPPGMSMPGTTQSAGPSETATMVCGPEIQEAVASILAPHPAPTTTSTWADQLYTCTYHLPTGLLVLSVKESPDAASATGYLEALRQRLGATRQLTSAEALGNVGYESAGGTVVVLKDGKTLQVDATGLPATSGPNNLSRADVAYEVATDILGCWSE